MTRWEKYGFADKIHEILDGVPKGTSTNPAFGRPFMTPYQIAMAFESKHPEIVKAVQLKVGGKGTGLHISLAQYIARELSRALKTGTMPGLDGALLSRQGDAKHEFKPGRIESSASGAWDLSMYRLRAQAS